MDLVVVLMADTEFVDQWIYEPCVYVCALEYVRVWMIVSHLP